jgi:DNA-binding PadR family transcriptional regulator
MYLDILILAMIRDTPRHGYDIKKRVGGVLGLGVSLNNNILYPALRRFEAEGAVKSKLQQQDGSPARRVFQLTARGDELLRNMLEDFPAERAESDPEFLVRLAFFDLVDREVRLDILATRRQVLQDGLDHVGRMRKLLDPKRDRYPVSLVDFLLDRLDREIVWIDGLKLQVTKERRR